MDLTPEEQQFFATGDSSVLGLSETPAETPIAPGDPDTAPTPPSEVPDPLADLQRQLAAERASKAQLEASLAQLAAQAKPTEQVVTEPDLVTDPLGAMMHKLSEITKTVSKLSETNAQQQTAQAQQQHLNEFVQNVTRMRDEFSKTQPDFKEAYAHLRTRRMEDLRDVGVPEAQLHQAMIQDELAVSQNAIAQGKNPASVIYNMAKRYGYSGKAPITPPATNTSADKIAALEKGGAAAINPAKGGIASELTFAGLKEASDSDLNKMVQDGKLWNNLVGGKNNDIF